MIDVTVIGCGFMGEFHARAVHEHPLLRLASAVDVDEERADAVATKYGADEALTEHGDAFADADAAIVATPEPYHAEQAHAALDRDVDLLLEKPPTDDLDTARALAERALETDLVTGVSFVLRYDPAYATARERAQNGDLGEIVSGRAKRAITADESRRIGARGHPNFYMSIHDIDALLACIDSRVRSVSAVERKGELADIDVPDSVQALLEFENGTTAVVEGYGVLPANTPGGIQAAFELVGTNGSVSVDTPGTTIEVLNGSFDRPDTRHWPVINGEMDGAVARQIDRFAKAVAGDATMVATVEDGYRAQRVADAIRRAAETDSIVDLDPREDV
ncbi:hypothetical protein CV102_23845 [Natronococcus pandeyae]|uniref:Gfo/Idh/MocA family oxidoreductase n=1 Tax=Natronococcus pandeyae TaxID=2055836 RepID=A0A8J8Q0D1_9EURY|nr:Gfo/Idh/MocA family oxidoreductase [Natronococcus pandeyae]TYL36178.1 hypothetical protein CV102_23845 [Natronococcus pandeyae]